VGEAFAAEPPALKPEIRSWAHGGLSRRIFHLRGHKWVELALLFYRNVSGLSNVKILITLSYGEGCVWAEEFMAEDLGEENIVGLIFGFEAVATEGAVGRAQVAGFPR
jgi:hypothetical protein